MRLFLVLSFSLLTACNRDEPPPLPPLPAAVYGTETAVFPVLLLSSERFDPILCVCKTPAQLRQRKDTELPLLRSNASLIDAAGTRFTVRMAHPVKGPRSGLMSFLVATVLPNEPLAIDIRIHPEGAVRNTDVWAAAHTYHERFRHCGLSPNTPAVEIIRGFSNKNCVWPPM